MGAPSARTLKSQDEISHYRIVGPLGAGGMGEVYLAQDRTLERSVALKILPPDLVRSEERVRRFVLEAKSASSLSHPNIVTIYEIGQDAVRSAGEADSAPVHFISMELVKGRTLAALIHDEKTDLRTLLGHLAQAAEGLAKAHAAGIVHRDLKPGNVMVTDDGFAKVLDFGLAKLTEKGAAGPDVSSAPTVADATGEGVVVGTAGYMSPEQVQGKSVDHRSDIFSFGSILYEAATRRRPFMAETGVETMHKILHDRPAPVEELNPAAPAELRRLIRRCLAKNPEQRLQSMKDLALELREIADEYETLSASASSGSVGSGAAPATARRGVPVAAWIGGAAGALVVTLGLWLAFRGGAGKSDAPPVAAVEVQTSRGDVEDCVVSPDGRFLAYLAGPAGHLALRVRQIATGSDVEVVAASAALIRNPSFSPDGNYVFYTAVLPEQRNYLKLFQVPSLGGAPRERAFDVDSRATFSPDGSQLAFWRRMMTGREARLIAFEMEAGKERVVATLTYPETFDGHPAWSPDGRRIAGIVSRFGQQSSVVASFDADRGRRQDLVKMERAFLQGLAWLHDGTGLVANGQTEEAGFRGQVFLITYPRARVTRITHDVNDYGPVSTSAVEGTIATVRNTTIANLWLADAAGGIPRRLTSVTNPETSPFRAEPLENGSIASVHPVGKRYQLRTLDPATGATRALTSEGLDAFNPHATPGGVLFHRLDETTVQVWRIGVDGDNLRQLTTGAGAQIQSVSRDGRLFLISHFDSLRKLSVVAAETGTVVRQFTETFGQLGFSPDNTSVILGRTVEDERGLSRTEWEVRPLTGGPPTARFRLPETSRLMEWAPDGSVTYQERGDPNWNLRRQSVDGGAPVPVTRFTEGQVTDYEWSRDGRRLAVERRIGEVSNVWVVDADGGNPTQVTRFTGERVFEIRWMPDDRGLAVQAGTSASDAVLLRDFR